MFGAGYVAAQDRLFFIDVLRHAGRAELSSFVGGAPGNRAMDAEQWSQAPYTEADLQHQYDLGEQVYGAKGAALKQDASDYVAGINQYISEARLDPSKMPGEYAAIGRPQGPDDWKVTDLFATASLVGGIFGKGGGQELAQVELLRAFTKKFGQKKGRTLWEQFAAFEDTDAPTTVTTGKRFPYQAKPKGKRVAGAEVLPDKGSFKALDTAPSQKGGSARAAHHGGRHERRGGHPRRAGRVPDRDVQRAAASRARSRQSGHPIAVFGPQVGYFAPQILMEEDLHGPGIDARGAVVPRRQPLRPARPRPRLRLERDLGRPGHHRHLRGAAVRRRRTTASAGSAWPIETLDRTNSWSPNAADSTPAGSETLHAQRTKLGLVAGRGTDQGQAGALHACCARPTCTRSTRPSASPTSTTPT